jgi:hypothetical protein
MLKDERQIQENCCGADVRISASLANASAAKVSTVTLKHVETFVDMSTDGQNVFILCS